MFTKDQCNANITISCAHYKPSTEPESIPVSVKLRVEAYPPHTWEKEFIVTLDKLTAKTLQQECPFIQFEIPDKEVTRLLREQLQRGLQEGTIPKGWYFHETGAVYLPNGTFSFLRGSELIPGECEQPHVLDSEIADIQLLEDTTTAQTWIVALQTAPLQALLVIAYVMLTSIRSLVRGVGVSLQAILYIVGGQGLGKTTLATRLAGIYWDRASGTPANIAQAGSSISGTEHLFVIHRDQPVIVDDLCRSAGRDTERKRRELGAKVIREGSGDIPIIKKRGKGIEKLTCNAGVILTAEYAMDNLSDLTRCLIVPVNERLNLSSMLTPELVGSMVRHYSEWFSNNSDHEFRRLKDTLDGGWKSKLEPRVRTNYICLRWAFQSLLNSLDDVDLRSDVKKELHAKMDEAVDMALSEHMNLKRDILEQFPVGNLAACLYEGYKNDYFDLTKKIGKLQKHEGIMWERDLCLRAEALIRYVRLQPGFHDWNRNKISRELKDIGALVLQEEGASTVHLDDDSPRVYRIRLDVLKDAAVYY